jgi:hypothetical protein
MSTPSDPYILTRRTDANMTGKEYFLVKAVGNNDMDLTGAGQLPIGALTNDVADGSTDAVYLPVQVGQIIKVVAGGACTAGTLCMSDGSGEAVNVSTGNHAFGIALGTYVNGEVGAFLWAPSYYKT